MSLEKKDVRTKISPEAHTALSSLAEYMDKDITELASFLLERSLLGELHAAKVLAQRAARWGSGGNGSGVPGEIERRSQGIPGKQRFGR